MREPARSDRVGVLTRSDVPTIAIPVAPTGIAAAIATPAAMTLVREVRHRRGSVTSGLLASRGWFTWSIPTPAMSFAVVAAA